MKLKKIPYYLLLLLLTAGASTILGFLSFGGMFALWPILPLAFGAFGLAVLYESEIYLQSIRGALKKLSLKRDYLKDSLANHFLLKQFKSNALKSDPPPFFKAYEHDLKQLNGCHDDRQRKKIEKDLSIKEHWFAHQLYPNSNEDKNLVTDYQKNFRDWLITNGSIKAKANDLLNHRRKLFNFSKLFSVVSAIFMSLGTSYLLVGTFTSIPFLASISITLLPAIIVPMALIAGIAYGFLTYNAITDMITNKTLSRWYKKIKQSVEQGFDFVNVFMLSIALILGLLAIIITICTAGTWWTIAKNTPPLFAWMGKMPMIIMGILNPMITGISALIFSSENTNETLIIIEDTLRHSSFNNWINKKIEAFNNLRKKENWLQILNPFRLLSHVIIATLRFVLFIGHIISYGVTADRVFGIPEIITAIICALSEGIEDAHFFLDQGHHHTHSDDHCDSHSENHSHGHDLQDLLKHRLKITHGHDHSDDIPTKLLKIIFFVLPLPLIIAWDYFASKLNTGHDMLDCPSPLTWDAAWAKYVGQPISKKEPQPISKPKLVSDEPWLTEQAIYLIERYKQKHLSAKILSTSLNEKVDKLTELQHNLNANLKDNSSKKQLVATVIADHVSASQSIYEKHRFFNNGPTRTMIFLEQLSVRVGVTAACA